MQCEGFQAWSVQLGCVCSVGGCADVVRLSDCGVRRACDSCSEGCGIQFDQCTSGVELPSRSGG